ncbi:MAG: imelysin family protein [Pseudomonadota bacterium]|nr:imelysin family protein [Pseudomonadota bacterium]
MNSLQKFFWRAILLFSFNALLVACSGGGGNLPVPDPSVLESVSGSSGQQLEAEDSTPLEQKLLLAVAEEIILPNYETLKEAADNFIAPNGPLETYCDLGSQALTGSSDFRDSFHELVNAVEATEMHALGPAMANGAQLRNKISSYHAGPVSNCGIDEIAVLSETAGFDLSERPANQRGMGALDYLLFNKSLLHSCPPQASTTADWNGLSESVRFEARCTAAKLLSADLANAASSIHNAWHTDEGDFISEFTEEATVGQNFQSLTDAMFFLEEGAKDAKLGNPLGIVAACSSTTCPNMIQFPHSKLSLAAVEANVIAFQSLFNVNDETGFDSVISGRGFEDVSQRFIENTQAVRTYMETIEKDLNVQVDLVESEAEAECMNAAANPDVASEDLPACTLYGLIKRVVDDMKIDFVTILNVNLPGGTRADND